MFELRRDDALDDFQRYLKIQIRTQSQRLRNNQDIGVQQYTSIRTIQTQHFRRRLQIPLTTHKTRKSKQRQNNKIQPKSRRSNTTIIES